VALSRRTSVLYYEGMPKVSQEHLERRRQQILDAATECFAKQGFHATSMQDIFRASGLSAGAVYRYFPSKNSLIKAIAENMLNEVLAPAIDAVSGQCLDPADALAAIAVLFEPSELRARTLPVTVQVWAESFRDPEMADLARDMLNHISKRLGQILSAGTPPEAGRLIMAALQGFTIQSGILDDVSPELVAAASRAFAAPRGEG
jgi:TetR/AcrR family transcriptional regulator, transcriptional repressor of aconitase